MKNILIVAGHDAEDIGKSCFWMQEHNEALALAKEVVIRLNVLSLIGKKASARKVKTLLYSSKKNLLKRQEISKLKQFDLILEFHFDYSSDPLDCGTTLFTNSKELNNIDKTIEDVFSIYFKSNGFKYDDSLFNLKEAPKHYIRVNICFLSNREEMKLFALKYDAIAEMLANELIKEFQ